MSNKSKLFKERKKDKSKFSNRMNRERGPKKKFGWPNGTRGYRNGGGLNRDKESERVKERGKETEKNKMFDGLFIEWFGQATPFGAITVVNRRPRRREEPTAGFPSFLLSHHFISPCYLSPVCRETLWFNWKEIYRNFIRAVRLIHGSLNPWSTN